MPGIAHYYQSLGLDADGKPPNPAPDPPPAAPQADSPVQPEPKGLTPTQKMRIALLQDAIKRAVSQPVVEPETPEDPKIRRHREVLTGEGEPASPRELAGATRWILENRNLIEN